MKLISHRGNVYGREPSKENTIKHITRALSLGYDVEIDLWLIRNKTYLGHDSPDQEVSINFLMENKDKLWCHAKNIEALCALSSKKLNTFFHDKDDATITTKGFLWLSPWVEYIPKNSIIVSEEIKNIKNKAGFKTLYGACLNNLHG